MGSDRRIGDKAGPRLAELMARAVILTRRELAPHEARVRAAGTQIVVDQMGEELAEVIDPIMRRLLARGEMPADLHNMIAKAASGKHQWQSTALSVLGMTGATSALGTVISNYLTPVVAGLVAESPHLKPDIGTLAQLAARGWIGQGAAENNANEIGYNTAWFLAMENAAMAWPDPSTITELMRRGHIGGPYAEQLLRQVGVPGGIRGLWLELAKAILSPADVALAVLRGSMDRDRAVAIAGQSGYNSEQLDVLISNTGEPLGLMQLLEAFRRGIIDRSRLERGIRQSRVRDEWIDTAVALRFEPMSTADAADAALRGHLSEAQAQRIAGLNGLRPEDWPAYFANQGNPPAPEQLLELWRRGFIGEAEVDRGLLEGRTRNEWIPAVRELRYEPISTADAVDAWLRHHIDRARAEKIMAENGLMPRDHDIAFANAGNPLGLEELLEAFRRGIIDQATFERGFHESRYRDEWAGTALKLRYRRMSTADAVEAAVQGHLTVAQAKAITTENGLAPEDFDAAYQTAGSPLSRTELEQLYNRGLIDLETVKQGLRESRLKDKYVDQAVELHVRLPEARQVLMMLEQGVVDLTQATDQLLQLGYSAQVAGWLIAEAEARSTGGHRQLATAQILALYEEQLTDEATALGQLGLLHYTPATAGQLLGLADDKRRRRILDTAITAVRKQYLEYRLDDLEATADLSAINLPPDSISLYLQVWALERKAQTRQLTPAQIVKAHKLGLLNTADDPQGDDQATTRLVQLGYSEGDAALLLAGA